ncbi:hypothetical protein TIFTF001_051361 [Ficus carica]|uniref:Uncharacterized protein n=1 Tax=Ficus carica TaxID=3494 RepID=A0AA88CPB7_FICCA|nr:hypothetical protein TIFTF001_051361 [Ficus carica]
MGGKSYGKSPENHKENREENCGKLPYVHPCHYQHHISDLPDGFPDDHDLSDSLSSPVKRSFA